MPEMEPGGPCTKQMPCHCISLWPVLLLLKVLLCYNCYQVQTTTAFASSVQKQGNAGSWERKSPASFMFNALFFAKSKCVISPAVKGPAAAKPLSLPKHLRIHEYFPAHSSSLRGSHEWQEHGVLWLNLDTDYLVQLTDFLTYIRPKSPSLSPT